MQYAAAVLLLFLAPFPAGAQTQTSRIQGKVVAEDGAPLAGATVFYKRSTKLVRTQTGSYRLAPGEREFGGQVTTAADGSFAIPNLPAGDYGLCALASGFLSTCAWSASVGVKLAAGQSVDAGRISLKPGALVQVRLNDPSSLLFDQSRTLSPVIIGVRMGTRFTAAAQVSKDATGRTFSLRVPYGVPLKLWVHSRFVRLADTSGTPLDTRGSSIDFTVPPNTTPSGFTLNVQERLSP